MLINITTSSLLKGKMLNIIRKISSHILSTEKFKKVVQINFLNE